MLCTLSFVGYCGMSTIDETDEAPEMRREAARIIRKRRASGHPVSIIARGAEWEVGEPEDCVLVPDTAGILSLVPLDSSECCAHCGADIRNNRRACWHHDDPDTKYCDSQCAEFAASADYADESADEA